MAKIFAPNLRPPDRYHGVHAGHQTPGPGFDQPFAAVRQAQAHGRRVGHVDDSLAEVVANTTGEVGQVSVGFGGGRRTEGADREETHFGTLGAKVGRSARSFVLI